MLFIPALIENNTADKEQKEARTLPRFPENDEEYESIVVKASNSTNDDEDKQQCSDLPLAVITCKKLTILS